MTDKSSKPLIGVTCNSNYGPDWVQHAPGNYTDYVFREYSRALEFAGGIPILIPMMEDLEMARAVVSRIDGLLLTGGPDISPRLFGEEPKVGIREINYDKDLMEVELVREAEIAGVPILGICRGIQLISVACGGTLYQDIFTQVSGCLAHNQKAAKRVNTHTIKVTKKSKLFKIVGAETVWVNSNHHQAVKDLPPGFVTSAVANDGIVEAIERPDYPFLLGVQWHPEGTWTHDEVSRNIFAALVKAAKRFNIKFIGQIRFDE